jgi:hypothetical protein
MVIVWAMLAFLIGISAASMLVVLMLAGRRNERYWSLVNRHAFIGSAIKLALATFVAGCGAGSAYWVVTAAEFP